MRDQLDRSVLSMFDGTHRVCHKSVNPHPHLGTKFYMEIPIEKDVFELPTMALRHFFDLVKEDKDLSMGKIVAILKNYGVPYFKTLNRNMQDIIWTDFNCSRLTELKINQGDGPTLYYYATNGAVFDSDMLPVMLATWKIERRQVDGRRLYRFIKPILHISTNCFLSQSDPMQRWICKKMSATCLKSPYNIYALRGCLAIERSIRSIEPSIEISDIPFEIIKTEAPSVSTTDQDLLQIAADNITDSIA